MLDRLYNIESLGGILGKRIDEISDLPSHRHLSGLVAKVVAAGVPQVEELELKGFPCEGVGIYEVRVFPRRDLKGAIVGAAMAIVDIGHRKQTETPGPARPVRDAACTDGQSQV